MKTQISKEFSVTAQGQEAEAILRSCVHCGFCTATCPTYQELCDERDGPRGRIYLIKQLLEGDEVTEKTRTHLDRCLTCRSCETTCPSGVQYGRLVDIGRGVLEKKLPRSKRQQLVRWGLRQVLPHSNRFAPLLKVGQWVKPILPAALGNKIPAQQASSPWPAASHPRKMIALQGCAQPAATPNTLAATARVLDRLGISLLTAPESGCCGAVSYHLAAHDEGLDFMRKNIDAWWPAIEAGAEAVVVTASGCGAMVQEYGQLLRDDPQYADKAARVSELFRDISEVLANEDISVLGLDGNAQRIAVHCPCTLQHALKQSDTVQNILTAAGFELTRTRDNHLCCGSAGTYSILQPELSQKLLTNKLKALTVDAPEVIVTANIGCQLHLQSRSEQPVQHWIELLDR